MTQMLLRRATTFTSLLNYRLLASAFSFSSRAARAAGYENEANQLSVSDKGGITSSNYENSLHLSPLFLKNGAQVKDYNIELVDDETWRVSTGLASAWRGTNPVDTKASSTGVINQVVSYVPPNKEDHDFDEIEDMRIRGTLFYKLDRGSKEFEEYSFDFHGRKSWGERTESKNKEYSNSNLTSRLEKSSKNGDERKESKRKENPSNNSGSRGEWLPKIDRIDETNVTGIGKRVRTPTFNQLTAPYHEPFCLDIYISKASVRACIIHRATSKVVAVAHSISKDMKSDLGSTRNATACAAVGEVLAQRALADDIHNVVYTPRKGEKLEGKLQVVLESVMTNGINVKVKIKQRKFRRAGHPPTAKVQL